MTEAASDLPTLEEYWRRRRDVVAAVAGGLVATAFGLGSLGSGDGVKKVFSPALPAQVINLQFKMTLGLQDAGR